MIPKYGRTEAKVGLRLAERIIIFETLQLILALYFKMLSVPLSGLVLIRNFFWGDKDLPSSCLLASLHFRENLKFLTLTSHIYFYLDDSELWKQYQSISQEMTEQICDLETAKPQEIPIKVCVILYDIKICYRASFLAII